MINDVKYSALTKIVSHINNPNVVTGTLIEEVPCDIGRSYAGYKRGGILEGAEKLRKEVMAAAVWLFGIPSINKLGNFICDKVLKIPTKIDFCNNKEGNDCIRDSVEFLSKGYETIKEADENVAKDFGDRFKNVDYSGLVKSYKGKFKGADIEKMVRRVKGAKIATSLIAFVANCALMGVVLPKFNQWLTSRKLKEQKAQLEYSPKMPSFEEFVYANSKQNNQNKGKPNFTGLLSSMVYNINNNSTFRLVATDAPTIAGRIATSRNKFEALEFLLIDGLSIYFYNFCANNIQKFLRFKNNTPEIDPKISELIMGQKEEVLNNAFEKIKEEDVSLKNIFNQEIIEEIYKNGTYGKYGKINSFVKNSDLENIDNQVIALLKHVQTEAEIKGEDFIKNGLPSKKAIETILNKINKSNAKYLAAGLTLSILGLSIIVPRLTFLITKLITGKDQFTGIADYSKPKEK